MRDATDTGSCAAVCRQAARGQVLGEGAPRTMCAQLLVAVRRAKDDAEIRRALVVPAEGEAEAQRAHRELEGRKTTGKLLLIP